MFRLLNMPYMTENISLCCGFLEVRLVHTSALSLFFQTSPQSLKRLTISENLSNTIRANALEEKRAVHVGK